MIKNLQEEIEKFRITQIEIQIEKHKHLLSEDALLQCYLVMINQNLQVALKEYIIQLLDYAKNLPLPSNNELAVAFSQSFIPINTPFIKKFKQVKKIIEKVNLNVLNHFRKIYDEMRNIQCKKMEQQIKENDFSKCVCAIYQKTKTPKSIPNAIIIICFMCRFQFHNTCLRYKIKDGQPSFVCPQCILMNMDPLHKVENILAFLTLETRSQSEKSTTMNFTLNQVELNQSIDIRCIRLDGYRYEQSWPDIGDLMINGIKVVQFKPLKVNSSLKYRKDEYYTIKNPKQGQYRIVLRSQSSNLNDRKNFQIKTDQLFYFGAFLIQEISSTELIQQYQFDKSKWVNTQQMKDNIWMYSNLNQSVDIAVNKISVSLICQITTLPIKIPCRGILCEHIQCFCLDSFCKFIESLTQKKWSCPVCKRICLDFYIDGYQYSILEFLQNQKTNKQSKLSFEQQVSNINFDKNGHYLDNFIDGSQLKFTPGRNYFNEIYQQKKQIKEDQMVKL
ncbi:unnamed protein product [Paramecium sonneborni]|uniref:SP-RING-type domain-containing protein n=1 Tax=Paramecium sonneborni TaxID=65129 RepID=A0A8S1P259_9CILI|nr:unnamed protein product [Paramecium sonneborni]